MHWSRRDMLRITENAENGKTIRLRLDGTVTSSSYSEVEEAFARHRAAPQKIILLDMAGVVFMDNEGASKLAGLRGEQLIIINCSPFIETLLNTVERSNPK
jgi:anti-anti-sigma regulatory factor